MKEEPQVYMKGIDFSTEQKPYVEKNEQGVVSDISEPTNLFNDEGFIAYPIAEAEEEEFIGFNSQNINVKYYNSYPVKVLNKDNVKQFVESLGRCLVVTGGSKFDKNDKDIDPYFSEYSPEIMFRVGFNVGLRWKSDFNGKMGFNTVCCGSMTEDTAYNSRETSFACDWLFVHGFALGYYMIEQESESESQVGGQKDPDTDPEIERKLQAIKEQELLRKQEKQKKAAAKARKEAEEDQAKAIKEAEAAAQERAKAIKEAEAAAQERAQERAQEIAKIRAKAEAEAGKTAQLDRIITLRNKHLQEKYEERTKAFKEQHQKQINALKERTEKEAAEAKELIEQARVDLQAKQEKYEAEIQKHLKSLGIDVYGKTPLELGESLEEKHPWVKLARQDLPIVSFKDLDRKFELRNAAFDFSCREKKYIPNDFDYVPFGRTAVYYDLKDGREEYPTSKHDILNTRNSVKEMIEALCLANVNEHGAGIVIAIAGGPTVAQNMVLFTAMNKDHPVKIFSIVGANGKEGSTGAVIISRDKSTYEDKVKEFLEEGGRFSTDLEPDARPIPILNAKIQQMKEDLIASFLSLRTNDSEVEPKTSKGPRRGLFGVLKRKKGGSGSGALAGAEAGVLAEAGHETEAKTPAKAQAEYKNSFIDNLSATKYRIYYLLKERKFTTQGIEEDNLYKQSGITSEDYAASTFSGFTTGDLDSDAKKKIFKLRDYSEWCVSHIIDAAPGATILFGTESNKIKRITGLNGETSAVGGSRKKNKSKKKKKKQNRTMKKRKGVSKRINSKKKKFDKNSKKNSKN